MAGPGPSSLSTLSPSARDAVDPIAELLSQLSGVRRVAGSSSSQLHQLQMELQLQRQQAQAQRQTLDRLARRPPTATSAAPASSSSSSQPHQQLPAPQAKLPTESGQASGARAGGGFLLASLAPDDTDSEPRAGAGEEDSAKQDMFLAELLLGALSLQSDQEEQS